MMIPYYDRNGITIYCGDCLEIMPLLEPPFDAIICDLPYGTTACSWDTIIPFEPLWENYKRLIKKDGAVVLFGGQPFTSKLVMSNLKWFRHEWIWEKDNAGNFVQAQRYPLKYHENILIFCNETSFTYNPQKWNARKISNTGGSKPKNLVSGGDKIYQSILSERTTYRYPKSIIKFNCPNSMVDLVHPTQKPLNLLQYLARTYTNSADLILDNAMGSGTTLLAAQNEGRRAVGIEISEEYCRVAVDRLKQPSFFSVLDKSIENKPKQLTMEVS